ncbi:YaaA family protein [Phocaeicola salanitronis]|uniref:YaaA family protein n=1 Tax=Phocaeicola salanitronis TaxID=376805 RepID=UPI0025A367C0|nr:YaaA family protein [Phocaeicola salanitronis]MDM8307268.1 YaaA family protein [Phocaeicola salanitronis]
MILFISCSKTMTEHSRIKVPFTSLPLFKTKAKEIALDMVHYSASELAQLFYTKPQLAADAYVRLLDFPSETGHFLPAILAYTGIAFKHINPKFFTPEDFDYAQQHLFISSFLYGVLRPLDVIKNYRLEGHVRLPQHECTIFDYWKPLLTDYFIEEIKKQGGILLNLASGEMKNLFDWERVCKEVRVITPDFYVYKDGKPKSVIVYIKMCRGEMTKYILQNRIEDPKLIKKFEWEGFTYQPRKSTPDNPVFMIK